MALPGENTSLIATGSVPQFGAIAPATPTTGGSSFKLPSVVPSLPFGTQPRNIITSATDIFTASTILTPGIRSSGSNSFVPEGISRIAPNVSRDGNINSIASPPSINEESRKPFTIPKQTAASVRDDNTVPIGTKGVVALPSLNYKSASIDNRYTHINSINTAQQIADNRFLKPFESSSPESSYLFTGEHPYTAANYGVYQSAAAKDPAAFFYSNLTDWATSIPMQHFWAVQFEDLNFVESIRAWMSNAKVFDEEQWDKFDTSVMYSLLTDKKQTGLISDAYSLGCFFARNVSIPGERTGTVNPNLGASSGGLLFPAIVDNRNNLQNLQISFMETNASFVDTIIRPWLIMMSYAGKVARSTGDALYIPPVNILATFYSKAGFLDTQSPNTHAKQSTSSPGPVPRKCFRFKGVMPVSVSPQEHSQVGEALQIKPVDFVYTSYTIDTSKLASMINIYENQTYLANK